MTKQSGKKERCCRHCYTQHSAVVERFTAAELSPSDVQPPPPGAGPQPPPEPASYIPTPRVTGEKKKHVYSLISQMSTCTDSLLVYVSDPHSSCKQKWKFSWGRRTETFTVNSCAIDKWGRWWHFHSEKNAVWLKFRKKKNKLRHSSQFSPVTFFLFNACMIFYLLQTAHCSLLHLICFIYLFTLSVRS